MKKTCPCGSNKSYARCCGPLITGKRIADCPEALMRSRYSAFTQANMDYITATMKGKVSSDFDPVSAKQWAEQAQWLGLEVVAAPPVAENGTVGFVEFIARYQLQGQDQSIHEVSEFHLEDGRWYYVDGKFRKPLVPLSQKTGRNDPCSCGSGKKYKKCCGG